MVDSYGRPLKAVWVKGADMKWLRQMTLLAVTLFDERFLGTEMRKVGVLDVSVSSTKIPAKGQSQPDDLYGLKLHCPKYGYYVSIIEPNKTKARNVQVYCKKAMSDKKTNDMVFQELMHFVYHPKEGQSGTGELVYLLYVPDSSVGVKY